MSLQLLVSVRTVEEALLAATHGADFIDLKEPRKGALGGLPPATVQAITRALREQGCQLPVSATIGDLPMHDLATILQRCAALCRCGVDYVKVGIEPGPGAAEVLDALAHAVWPAPGPRAAAIVPVFIADHGINLQHVAQAAAHPQRFPALMVDTAAKHGGSLFERVPGDALARFVRSARAGGALVGLAGALRLQHLPALARLAPDFAGFRTAVCSGGGSGAGEDIDRSSPLDPQRLLALARQLKTCAAEVDLAGQHSRPPAAGDAAPSAFVQAP